MKTVANGMWSGLVATGPMTLALFYFYRSLPKLQKTPLPPAILTRDIVGRPFQEIPAEARQNLTMLSHFGYGCACGVMYVFLQKKIRALGSAAGAMFGLSVWASSYLGWIPAFGFRPAAKNMSAQKNTMMIAAHIVWGLCLGAAAAQMESQGGNMLDGARRR